VDAAQELNVSVSTLKRRFSKFFFKRRWPSKISRRQEIRERNYRAPESSHQQSHNVPTSPQPSHVHSTKIPEISLSQSTELVQPQTSTIVSLGVSSESESMLLNRTDHPSFASKIEESHKKSPSSTCSIQQHFLLFGSPLSQQQENGDHSTSTAIFCGQKVPQQRSQLRESHTNHKRSFTLTTQQDRVMCISRKSQDCSSAAAEVQKQQPFSPSSTRQLIHHYQQQQQDFVSTSPNNHPKATIASVINPNNYSEKHLSMQTIAFLQQVGHS